jgi:hypothetical protein
MGEVLDPASGFWVIGAPELGSMGSPWLVGGSRIKDRWDMVREMNFCSRLVLSVQLSLLVLE